MVLRNAFCRLSPPYIFVWALSVERGETTVAPFSWARGDVFSGVLPHQERIASSVGNAGVPSLLYFA